MNPQYPLVAKRAGHRCEYCGAPEAVFNFPFEVEHVWPTIRGGINDDPNLALACRACNVHKADAVEHNDPLTKTEAPLFNPRRDVWREHFQVEMNTGKILGSTPSGRATLARLQMNTPVQIAARKQWMRLCIFPSS